MRRFEELLLEARGVVNEQDRRGPRRARPREFEAGYEYAQSSPFPEPGDVTRGLYTDDGYWASEPGREGGTEA